MKTVLKLAIGLLLLVAVGWGGLIAAAAIPAIVMQSITGKPFLASEPWQMVLCVIACSISATVWNVMFRVGVEIAKLSKEKVAA